MLGVEAVLIGGSIPSPGFNEVELGPLNLHMYGLMAALGVLAGIMVASRLWEARGGDGELVWDVAIWSVPAGLVGARLYHVVTSPDRVPEEWWGPLAIWDGGLGAWGGMAFGAIAGILVLRHHGVDFRSFLDVGAPGLLVGFSVGRIGNFFNQELFGRPTELPWALEIDAANRPSGYEEVATFHPTFLYEILWNLGLAGALIWLALRSNIRPPGIFALFVAGYSLGRVLLELLRIDPATDVLGMRINFWIGIGLVLAGIAWFAYSQGRLLRRGSAPPTG